MADAKAGTSDQEQQQKNSWKNITVNEAYHLKKNEIIEALEERGVQVEDSDKRDELRERLVELVKAEIAAEKVSDSDTEDNEEYNSSDSDMASDAKIFFRLESDDWEAFTERLELYFIVKNISTDDMKRAHLLTHCDEDTYKLFKNLCAPVKPATKTYSELVELLKSHLKPAPSEVMERCTFNRAKQEPNETVGDFATKLRRLALNCKFADLSVALRDQFVCGIFDESIRIDLFKMSELTFDTALKEATARENAMKNAASATKNLNSKNYKLENFAMGHEKMGRSKQGQRKDDDRKGTQFTSNAESQSRHGPEIKCYCCGGTGHETKRCRNRGLTCNFCHTKGHMERACIKKMKSSNKFLRGNDDEHQEEDNGGVANSSPERSSYSDFFSIEADVEANKSESGNNYINKVAAEPMFVKVEIEGKTINMEVDTGTYYTVMSEGFINKYLGNAKIARTDTQLLGYEDNRMEPRGQLNNIRVTFLNKVKFLNCLVLKGEKIPLIGRQWLSEFGLWPLRINTNTDITVGGQNLLLNINATEVQNRIVEEFKELFDNTPGLYNRREITLHVRANTKPIALGARHVAFALKPKVETELLRLEKAGHIERVDASEWATPIVPVLKSDGRVRVAGDFKRTLNPHLTVSKRAFPRIDDIFEALRGGQEYSQLDLPHAYMQIPVAAESRKYLTITTHIGLFRYKRLTEGTAVAPSEFQNIIEECIQGIPNTIAYMDNIFVTGDSREAHLENVRNVCKRLTERGLKLNANKCDFLKDRIDILGFVIDKNGLHKSKKKVKAMYEAPRPTNAKQLSSFLGLINFYERFLKHRADRLKPLFDCAKAEKFVWSKECEDAFWWVKNEIISPRVLAHYDPEEQLILAVDASHYGLSAILSHRYKDGSERPIAFASKKIPEKELNRAINDKEASAIVFGLIKFHDYVFGRRIVLRTDHKPLEAIFGPKKGLPVAAASRLQRWAYMVSGYQYDIEWVKSERNGNCDALSRLPIDDDTDVFGAEFSPIHYIAESENICAWQAVERETKRDKTLDKIIKFCIFGWPSNGKNLSEDENKFFSKRHELSVEQNCLFWGYRIIIPGSLREQILEQLHKTHLGVVKIKALARSYVWWPGVDTDIEDRVRACRICAENQKTPTRVPMTPWPWPEKPWDRIHCDFLGPFYGDMYLVVIDAHSKWPEVINFKSNTKASKLKEVFAALFARHGLPNYIVTDNGRQFASAEFGDFLKQTGVKHSFSPPYHPATNGLAENFVGTFKSKVDKIVQGGEEVAAAINAFIFDYRCTPHCTTGKSPAWLLYKRELKTRFDLLRPVNLREKVVDRQRAQVIAGHKTRRSLEIENGDQVLFDNHGVSGGKRLEGKIVKRLSPSTFQVQTGANTVKKCHANQIVNPLRRSARIANKPALRM